MPIIDSSILFGLSTLYFNILSIRLGIPDVRVLKTESNKKGKIILKWVIAAYVVILRNMKKRGVRVDAFAGKAVPCKSNKNELVF